MAIPIFRRTDEASSRHDMGLAKPFITLGLGYVACNVYTRRLTRLLFLNGHEKVDGLSKKSSFGGGFICSSWLDTAAVNGF